MRSLFGVLLAMLVAPAFAQTPEIRVPADLRGAAVERAMPMLARETLVAYRAAHPGDADPGVLFRLQLAAGQFREALANIDAVRVRTGPGSSWLFLQYELHARAKLLQTRRHLPYPQAWRRVFRERFGALDDATAMQAEFGFGGDPARMRSDFDAARAAQTGDRMPLADALELIRKYQVQDAYSAFVPLFAAALGEDDARRYVIDRNVLVRTPDGAHIAVLLYRPAKSSPLPTLLTFTIYANDEWARIDAKKMASRGYASVVAYSRGKGRSRDAIVPYEHDGADAVSVIDWITAHPWSDGRVGMYGGSYSGFTQWSALKHRPRALKAIATSATTAPGIDVPMEGGVFYNFLYPWPVYVTSNRALNDAVYGDAVRWERLNRDWYASGRAYRDLPAIDGKPNPVFANWLKHPAYDAYWQAMTPQGDEFSGVDIPVLATTGYFDGAQIGALHYFREHLRHRPNADHTLVIGPFEHFTMQTGVPPVVQGYAVDRSARIDLQELRLQWFDHLFKGAPKPALLAGRVNWQVMGADEWRHAPTLEAMATRTQRWYLVPGAMAGTQALSPQAKPAAVVVQRVDFSDRGDAGWMPPPTVVNKTLDPHLGLAFASTPMKQDTELSGPFSGELNFVVNKRDVDVAIGVYELNAAGEYLDLAFWVQRASYNADRRERHLLQPGVSQRIVVKDTRLLGRKLAAGSRIVVTLGVIKQPDRQLDLGSGREPSDETLADAGAPLEIRWSGDSYLDLPMRDTP